ACGGEVVDDVLGVRVREGVRGGADSGPDGSGVPLVRAAVRVRGGELVSGLDGVEEVEADTDRAAQRLPGAGRIHDPAEEREAKPRPAGRPPMVWPWLKLRTPATVTKARRARRARPAGVPRSTARRA